MALISSLCEREPEEWLRPLAQTFGEHDARRHLELGADGKGEELQQVIEARAVPPLLETEPPRVR